MANRERFEKHSDDYIKFDRVDSKRSQRPDLHAFLLLAELFPSTSDIVSGAGHDEIWLSPTGKQIETLTDVQILELVRCGVRYDSDHESLCMFV